MPVFLTMAEELKPYHLGADEIRCHAEDGGPCRECGGEIRLMRDTAEAFRVIRDGHGGPLRINSGYRCRRHQQVLFDAAVRQYGSPIKAARHVARPGGSAHEYGCALDIGAPPGVTPKALRDLAINAAGRDLRIGLYRSFIHIDTAYLLVPNPQSRAYVRGARWVG